MALAACNGSSGGNGGDYGTNAKDPCSTNGHNFVATEERLTCTSVRITNVCSVCSVTHTVTRNVTGEHDYVNNACTVCGEVLPASTGLYFTLAKSKEYYVSGIGSCKDEQIVIPKTYNDMPVTGIADDAFKNNKTITHVYIPDSITSIGASAFNNCTRLEKIDMSDTVLQIGESVFYGCTSLKSVSLSQSLTAIPENAFYKCEDLSTLKLSERLVTIAEGAFRGCSSLASVNLPDTLSSIGQSAFRNCSSLTSVTIPAGITTVEAYTFDSCNSLANVYINDGVEEIATFAFCKCNKLTEINIPASVTYISGRVFYGCTNLVSISVDEGNETFKSIDGNLYTKDGKTIVQYACGKSRRDVVIPEGVEKIGSFAFAYSDDMLTVTIPVSVTEIGDGAFAGCTTLVEIIVTPGNPVYTSYDGDLYKDEGMTLVQYASGKDDENVFVMPWVRTVAPYAFYDADKIIGVGITSGVCEIGAYAFYDCDALIAVAMSETVQIIGERAFYDCSSLEEVLLGKGVTTIGDYAFNNFSTHIRVFYAGSSLEWMMVKKGTFAFGMMLNSYTMIYYSETAPTVGDILDGNYYWHYDENGDMEIWHI